MDTKVIEKIQKLLALATSPNEHEAKLAAERANELMIKYNLSKQTILHHDPEPLAYREARPLGRMPVEDKFIFRILQTHFFVRILITRGDRRATMLHIIGRTTNVQVAQYIYEFLSRKYYELWISYRDKAYAPTTAKQSYYEGLTKGLHSQLQAVKAKVETETGLVVASDPKLEQELSKYRKHGAKFNLNNIDAMASGMEDGKKIQIHKGVNVKGQGILE